MSTAIAPLPYQFAKQYGVLLKLNDDEMTDNGIVECLYADAPPVNICNELQRHTGGRVRYTQVSTEDLAESITAFYQHQASEAIQNHEAIRDYVDLEMLTETAAQAHDLLTDQADAPVIRLLNGILTEALNVSASDIHIETFEETLTVRFRVDGVLVTALTPPRQVAQLLVSRVKVMSQLDIAEKRIPQDGRMSVDIAGQLTDVRVSTFPTNHGERIVLRLLETQATRLYLETLGATPVEIETLKSLLSAPHGLLLVTGPTGSGKTTTLYAGLNHLNDGSKNILTIEDPVEYKLEGVGQAQVNTKIDMSFARGLRAILRQDPDIVMVGEIRDLETAEIAIQASMTGHLVLSTLHTNTAIGAITRLMDLGIPPFLLSSSLVGVVAQRLVRKLCADCKTQYQPDAAELSMIGVPPEQSVTLFRPNGCGSCHHMGYRGRVAIYEVIPVKSALRRGINAQASEQELEDIARETTDSLFQQGVSKVLSGTTSLDEVLRVTSASQNRDAM